MRIIFVIGPTNAGKSTFIKEHFPGAKIIDMLNYQASVWPYDGKNTIEVALERYVQAKDALQLAIKNGYETIVLEHTLLKKARRTMYIDAVKELGDYPIECYIIVPSKNYYYQLSRNLKDAGISAYEYYLLNLSLLEIPDEQEFDSLHIVKPEFDLQKVILSNRDVEYEKGKRLKLLREALSELVATGKYDYGDYTQTWLAPN